MPNTSRAARADRFRSFSPHYFPAATRAFRTNFAFIVLLYYKLKEISSAAGNFFRFLSKNFAWFSLSGKRIYVFRQISPA